MRKLAAVVAVALSAVGCAATGSDAVVPGVAPVAAPPTAPQALGRPAEQLSPRAHDEVRRALQERGRLEPVVLPGELRAALLRLQQEEGLAPTGWLDADTARLLDLDVDEVLPIEAGAGALHGRGTYGLISQVGGEPGPGTLPPDPQDLGAEVPVETGDALFHYDEARRLRAAAAELRGSARLATDRSEKRRIGGQADKALEVARFHAEQLEALGGERALAGLALGEGAVAQSVPPPEAGAVEEGEEVRAAFEEDEVDLPPAEIEAMQRSLYVQGFLHQAPTGVVDDETRSAIRAYQTSQARQPTGALDEETVRELVEAPEAEQPQGREPPGSPQSGGPAPGGEAPASGEGAEVREAP